MERLLGQLEVAEEADEGGEDAARLGTVDGLYPVPYLVLRVSTRHQWFSGYGRLNSRIGRTSTLPSRADGILEATWMASFRSRAWMR